MASQPTRESSLELEASHSLASLRLRDLPYSNLDDHINGGHIVVHTGYSVIRRATLRQSNRAIAVKTSKTDATAVKRTLREIHIWSQLQHENIIPLLGITTKFDRTVSMVTEWMERGNAHQYVQDITVDPRPLLLDIACGMNYLHSHGIAHGDLKGENVLISGGGRALITDFGFSCLLNPPPILDVDPPRGGTLSWMAPEKLDTCAVTREADVWAFGMTTLELFSRRDPFHGVCTKLGTACRILQGPPTRPSWESTCYRLCDGWWNMCLECWKHDPSARQAMNDIVVKVEQLNEETLGGRREMGGDSDREERTGGEREGGRLWVRLRQLMYYKLVRRRG